MGHAISPLAVRRSTWISATPERVWQEFTTFERMKAWFGTGHTLTVYEPRLGGRVETDAASHQGGEAGLVFGGKIIVWEPAREVTWENDWFGRAWPGPSLMTIRLAPYLEGTIVELFHHHFEDTGAAGDMLNGFESGWDCHHLEALRGIVEG